MIRIVGWLAGTKLGRWTVAAAILLAAFVHGLLLGGNRARQKAERRNLEALKKKKEVSHEVNQMDADDLDHELDRWMRD